MDYQQPPAIIIVTTVERRDVRAETIEHVARLLCRADGCNPDDNIQCGPPSITSYTTCTLLNLPYPTDRRWYAYREKAEALLKSIFGETK